MYFEQFYLGCLAHASYLLASQGEAVVVDAQRDVDLYLKAAADHGSTIRHVFKTLCTPTLSPDTRNWQRTPGPTSTSVAKAERFKHVQNVVGGFDAWQEAKLPSVTAVKVWEWL